MTCATLIKFQLSRLQLPTFYEGIAYSLNYATVFCAAYLLHCTIATKLPAHTAAALANSVRANTGHSARLQRFTEIWRAMVRLQIAGLLGNVLVAGPLAYALDVLTQHAFGGHLLDAHAAQHVLDANSILGPSAAFAALTGVFLWLSSLIGAAADNWTRVVHLVERLSTNLHVMRSIGPERARSAAEWWVSRFGGLTGNIALGFMLGGIPALFAIVQLPVEIRHVTVSASSFALALARGAGDLTQLWLAAIGVLTIGAVNVTVSFALALRVALSATETEQRSSARALIRSAIARWLHRQPLAGHSGRRSYESPDDGTLAA
jgi:site-specific recombinase